MRTRIPRKITGAAIATLIILSNVMPALPAYAAGNNGNVINSQDNTPGGGSSGGNSYNNIDTDSYEAYLKSIIETYRPNDSRDEYMKPGGAFYESHVHQVHEEWTDHKARDVGWRTYVTEYHSSSNEPIIEYGNDTEKYTVNQPNRNVDTIEVCDLSRSEERYTEKAYTIFLPGESKKWTSHYINSDSYRDAFDNGGKMDIYSPFYDIKRKDTVTYSEEFNDYICETEETYEIDLSNALTECTKENIQLGKRTGRFQAELTNARNGQKITVETVVLDNPNGTPCITFGGLPAGDYKVTWWSEHDAWSYTRERWYCGAFVYCKETKRAILVSADYYEKQNDWEYCESYWVQDEIQPYSFSTSGGDITITDGGEAWTYERIE